MKTRWGVVPYLIFCIVLLVVAELAYLFLASTSLGSLAVYPLATILVVLAAFFIASATHTEPNQPRDWFATFRATFTTFATVLGINLVILIPFFFHSPIIGFPVPMLFLILQFLGETFLNIFGLVCVILLVGLSTLLVHYRILLVPDRRFFSLWGAVFLLFLMWSVPFFESLGRSAVRTLAVTTQNGTLCFMTVHPSDPTKEHDVNACLDESDPNIQEKLESCSTRDETFNLGCRETKTQRAISTNIEPPCEELYPGAELTEDTTGELLNATDNASFIKALASRSYKDCIIKREVIRAVASGNPKTCNFLQSEPENNRSGWVEWASAENACLGHFVGSTEWEASCRYQDYERRLSPGNTEYVKIMQRNCCMPTSGDPSVWDSQIIDLAQFPKDCRPIY